MAIDCWVVMGNDYPAAVFSTEQGAADYILLKKWYYEVGPDGTRGHIHWRSYRFDLDVIYVPDTMKPEKIKSARLMTYEELLHEWFYWHHRTAKAQGSLDFKAQVNTELLRRNVDPVRLVRGYDSVVAAEHRRLSPPRYDGRRQDTY